MFLGGCFYLQLGVIPLLPQLVHEWVSLLHHNLHLVVLVGHLLHFLHRLLQAFLQLLILGLEVHVFFLGTLNGSDDKVAFKECIQRRGFSSGTVRSFSRHLKILKVLAHLHLGQVQLPLSLSDLVFGGERLFAIQLSSVEIHILLQLFVLIGRKKDVAAFFLFFLTCLRAIT